MNANDEDKIKQLLRQALPRVEGDPEPDRDLWAAMLRRLHARPATPPLISWASLDWALLAAVVLFAAAFPASISVLFYCL